ncbi:Homeodomain-like domain-containing protein [Natronincola peptidivorans]|uniref:Homeodomain-like domain-containing protein n=1 Tax=Natronincola peptidivorans TaxID=426128 RepID=A0A1I0ELY9_9FIRM|nr:helix-turn-helix domain-containing protein [Natronincola peptidivorans]SET46208.1 Homeodomain-like domain-containing protein [Natronincola peptidivorans]
MDDLNYNYMALLEAILSPQELLPDLILNKYGLLQLTPKELRELEAMEMKRLYQQKWTYRQIAKRFGMSDSGVYRRMKRFG